MRFNSGGKMSGLFDFVLVTADLRASEESIDGKSSIIGRILERSIDRTVADDEIAKIVEESRAKQQKVYEEKFNAIQFAREENASLLKAYGASNGVFVQSVNPGGPAAKAGMMEFDMGSLSLDLGEDKVTVAGDFVDEAMDPLETKLALADEFRAIGDDDGARALIEGAPTGTAPEQPVPQRRSPLQLLCRIPLTVWTSHPTPLIAHRQFRGRIPDRQARDYPAF